MGHERAENHDFALAEVDEVQGMFVVVDGTSKLGSRQLAQALARGVIEGYQRHIAQSSDDSSPDRIERLLSTILVDMHRELFAIHTGSTSYLIGVVRQGKLTVAYEGDCACGMAAADGRIEWFTPPHCQANWNRDRTHPELALDPARNLVTRSFRASRFPQPDFVRQMAPAGTRFVFATDGFWAELSERQQAAALNDTRREIAVVSDDITWIDVWM
ncbi:serine/threonine protein phosphatase [Pseudomonas sp. SWRI51]|uniref:serine/threonine protein phosphatase n=1 Tax=Pseudomonas sp. SWRI51 TaxID=2745491 RepID=UPI001EE2A96A|nr:serine/threonine protein phosphatase [Pseudomonas sp. SWRI51]